MYKNWQLLKAISNTALKVLEKNKERNLSDLPNTTLLCHNWGLNIHSAISHGFIIHFCHQKDFKYRTKLLRLRESPEKSGKWKTSISPNKLSVIYHLHQFFTSHKEFPELTVTQVRQSTWTFSLLLRNTKEILPMLRRNNLLRWPPASSSVPF